VARHCPPAVASCAARPLIFCAPPHTTTHCPRPLSRTGGCLRGPFIPSPHVTSCCPHYLGSWALRLRGLSSRSRHVSRPSVLPSPSTRPVVTVCCFPAACNSARGSLLCPRIVVTHLSTRANRCTLIQPPARLPRYSPSVVCFAVLCSAAADCSGVFRPCSVLLLRTAVVCSVHASCQTVACHAGAWVCMGQVLGGSAGQPWLV
jgi:hypothetical protein